MDQTATTQAWMRGNMGGLRDATRELGLRSPRCFINQFGHKISKTCVSIGSKYTLYLRLALPRFLFPPLQYMAMDLIAIESMIYFTPLSATAASESKFRC